MTNNISISLAPRPQTFDDSSVAGAWTDSLPCHWHKSRAFSTPYASEDREIDRPSFEFSLQMLHNHAPHFPVPVTPAEPQAQDGRGKRRQGDGRVHAVSLDVYLGEKQKEITLSDASRVFSKADKDFNGQLDLEEVKEAFLELNLLSDESDVEYYFTQLDADQSGALG